MEEKTHIGKILHQKIKSGAVLMRPKYYFTAQVALMVVLSLAVVVLSLIILNFILFSIRVSGHEPLLGFGLRGIMSFFLMFPWPLLALDALLVAALLWCLKKFRIGTRSPLVVLLGIVVVATVGASVLFDRGFRVNDRLIKNNEHFALPSPLGFLYKSAFHAPSDGICMCEVLEVHEHALLVKDIHKQELAPYTVVVPDFESQATTSGIKVGAVVIIAGDAEGVDVRAFGVGEVEDPRTLFNHLEPHDEDHATSGERD